MTSEAAQLARIRDQLAAIAPGDWSRVYDAEGCFVEARGPMGELMTVCRFDAGATEDEIAFICDAPDNMRLLVGLVDRAIAAIARLRQPEPPREPDGGKDYAAECAMKCAEPGFRVFLEEKHGLERPLTDERVAQKVRGLLGVTSRRELNDGGRAAEAWKALRGEYETWRRAGR